MTKKAEVKSVVAPAAAIKKADVKAPETTKASPKKVKEVTPEPEASKPSEVVKKARVKVVDPEVAKALEALKAVKAKVAAARKAERDALKVAEGPKEKKSKRASAYKIGLNIICGSPAITKEDYETLLKSSGIVDNVKNKARTKRAWDRATDIISRLDQTGWLVKTVNEVK